MLQEAKRRDYVMNQELLPTLASELPEPQESTWEQATVRGVALGGKNQPAAK